MSDAVTVVSSVCPDVWTIAKPMRALGLHLGVRMMIVRLQSGALWLHSPVRLTDDESARLAELGPVRHAVAPNDFHHLYIGALKRRFPECDLYGAPGLAKKRADIDWRGFLGDVPPAAWADEIDHVFFSGAKRLHEIVFFHRASGTLMLTDVAFNVCGSSSPWTRFYLRLTGSADRLSTTLLGRLVMGDRKQARECVERMLAWDVRRVSVGHGSIVERDAKAALRDCFAWL